ncbi:hypothetical protein V8F33_008023 [Rhypophila sp. PSN 637]
MDTNMFVDSTPCITTASRPLIRIKTISNPASALPVAKPETATSEVYSPTPTTSARIWTGPLPLGRRPLTPHPEAIRSGMASNPSTPLVYQDGLWHLGKRHISNSVKDSQSFASRRPLQETLSPHQTHDPTESTFTPIAILERQALEQVLEQESMIVDEYRPADYIPINNDTSTLHRINEHDTISTPISAIRIFSPSTTTCAFPWSKLESHGNLQGMIMPI